MAMLNGLLSPDIDALQQYLCASSFTVNLKVIRKCVVLCNTYSNTMYPFLIAALIIC